MRQCAIGDVPADECPDCRSLELQAAARTKERRKAWWNVAGAFILGALVGLGAGLVFSAMAWQDVVEQYRLEARESNRARELALEQLQELAWPPVPMDNPRRRRPKQ